ncbi:Reverse transcriptase (RNA-dependent DNA polymerase) [Fragilaria crotonensis]|nr:Reverse transcriptase (RNA-dependent DNA polymerase) [Fragilaria crotonensis]
MQRQDSVVLFRPIIVAELTEQEKRRAMESLIFLVEKRDGTIKGRTCANRSTQREYMDCDEATSPTATTESIIITGVIDAKQSRDVMTADIPNAFVQSKIDKKKFGK